MLRSTSESERSAWKHLNKKKGESLRVRDLKVEGVNEMEWGHLFIGKAPTDFFK